MLFLPLALLSVLLAVVQARRAPAAPGWVRGALIQGGTAFLASWLLDAALVRIASSRLGEVVPAGILVTARGIGLALLALVLWNALARLAFYRHERKDVYIAIPFFGLSIVAGLVPDMLPLVAAFLALPALVRVRWRDEVGPATVGLAALFGFLFVLLNFVQMRISVPPGVAPEFLSGLGRYSDWVHGLAVFHVLAALPRLLWGLELPVRSVKRRLFVSHVLAGVVPLALVLVFWGLSTYLSVNGERARIASRTLIGEAEEYSRVLDAALNTPDPAGRLAAWADLQVGDTPSLRVWVRGDGVESRLARVYGDPMFGEEHLPAWPDTLRRNGVVLVGGTAWVGAAASRPLLAPGAGQSGGPDAVVLVPATSILGERFQRKIDATAFLETRYVLRSEESEFRATPRPAVVDGPDEALEPRDIGEPAPQTPRGEPAAGALASRRQASAGAGVVPAVEWSDGGWRDRRVLLWVRVGFFNAVRGLARNLQENPFNLIPLVFLGVVAIAFVLVEVLTLGMVVSMGRSILRALNALRQGTARLRSGNLRYRIPIEGEDDLWEVASSFNDMTADLDKARDMEMERERLEGELDLARQIQSRLLPGDVPTVQKTEMCGYSLAARQVGGDYYDYLPLRSGRIGIIIADVSGKGVPAALLMSSFRAALLSQDLEREGAGETMARLNAFLHRSVEPGRFVTAFLAVLDPEAGKLTYANAGHNPPLLVNAEGRARLLKEGGLVLGLFPETTYLNTDVILRPGDLLTLYTDGVTEAANEDDEFWGEERLLEVLLRRKDEPCRRIMREILSEVRAFSSQVGQTDDITLVCMRWKGDVQVERPDIEEPARHEVA